MLQCSHHRRIIDGGTFVLGVVLTTPTATYLPWFAFL